MTDPLVSHGRGGAANISRDPTPYADGSIVREGPVGDQGDGAYSTGRGGAANIGSPGLKAQTHNTDGSHHGPGDADVVPETALRDDKHADFHVGRGGQGNEVHQGDKDKGHVGLADKLKSKIFGGGK